MRQAEEMARKRGRDGEEQLLTAGGAGGQLIGFVAGYAYFLGALRDALTVCYCLGRVSPAH